MSISTASRVVVVGGTSGIGLATAKASRRSRRIGRGRLPATPPRSNQPWLNCPPARRGRAVDASSTEELATFFHVLGDVDHFAYTAAGPLVPTRSPSTPRRQAASSSNCGWWLPSTQSASPSRSRPGGSITTTCGTAAFRGGPG